MINTTGGGARPSSFDHRAAFETATFADSSRAGRRGQTRTIRLGELRARNEPRRRANRNALARSQSIRLTVKPQLIVQENGRIAPGLPTSRQASGSKLALVQVQAGGPTTHVTAAHSVSQNSDRRRN